MKHREVFLVKPAFVFTKCTSVVIQLTLETHLNPRLFKSTILTPTFSYKAEVKVAGAASQWLGRQQVTSFLSGQLPAVPASLGRAPNPSLAEPRSDLCRARGWQKG